MAVPLIDSIKTPNIFTIFQAKCNEKKDRLRNRIDNFDEKKNKHMEIYTKLQDRLSLKIEEWADMGYDTSKIEEDQLKLSKMVKEFSDEYSKYIDSLREAEESICNETEFEGTLEDLKEELSKIRSKAQDIKDFYYNTLRADILELKQQAPVVEEE